MNSIEEIFPLPAPNGRNLKIGVIGCGNMFRKCHAPALLELRGKGFLFDIVLLCDPKEESLLSARQFFPEALICKDFSEISDRHICDTYMIQLWPPYGVAVAKKLAEEGIPFFIEKPVSHDPEELESLAGILGKNRTAALVGYNRRSQAAAYEFRRIIDLMSGEKRFTARFMRAARKEQIFYEDILGHPVDFIQSCVGELKIETVRSWKPSEDGGINSGLLIEASFEGGSCSLELRPACGMNLESYECCAEKETVRLVYHSLDKVAEPAELVHYRPDMKEYKLNPASQESMLYIQGFVHQMAKFLRLVSGEDAGLYCNMYSAMKSMRIITEILGQLKELKNR